MEIISLRKQSKLLCFESIDLKCSYIQILCILFTNLAFEAQLVLHVTKFKDVFKFNKSTLLRIQLVRF